MLDFHVKGYNKISSGLKVTKTVVLNGKVKNTELSVALKEFTIPVNFF